MKVMYVAEQIPFNGALGQTLRRDGIIEGLKQNGYEVSTILVNRDVKGVETLKKVRCEFDANPSILIIFEGFEFSIFVQRHVSLNKAFVDVCDSRVLVASIDPKMRKSRAIKIIRKYLKIVRNGYRLRKLGKSCRGFIYISERDLKSDELFLNRDLVKAILPNGVNQNDSLRIAFKIDGDFLLVGNWSYAPNIEMLNFAIRFLENGEVRGGRALRIAGPNLKLQDIPSHSWITYLGWVKEKSDIYKDTFCLLAPIFQGGGVKNKVLEAISYGIPIFGLEEAFASIPMDLQGCCFPFKNLLNFNNEVIVNYNEIEQKLYTAKELISRHTWKNSVGNLLDEFIT
jgi:hypothetical protein